MQSSRRGKKLKNRDGGKNTSLALKCTAALSMSLFMSFSVDSQK